MTDEGGGLFSRRCGGAERAQIVVANSGRRVAIVGAGGVVGPGGLICGGVNGDDGSVMGGCGVEGSPSGGWVGVAMRPYVDDGGDVNNKGRV